MEPSLITVKPQPGERIGEWTLATDDTRLTIGATKDGQLVLCELSNPAAGWNWIQEPAVFPLVDSVAESGAVVNLPWTFKDATEDESLGQKVTVRFVCEEPALELQSEWWARPGRGPVHHRMQIANRSDRPVKLAGLPTMDLRIRPSPVPLAFKAEAAPLTLWSFHSEGFRGDEPGMYRNDLKAPFTWQIETSPKGQFIPYAVFDAGRRHGVYVGVEWSHCRIAVEATGNTVRVRAGEYDGFQIELAPASVVEAPPGFVGAYQGDLDDAGNSLRRFLFRYNMPAVVRDDPSYPKVQWNAFWATGGEPASWDSVEHKYHPLIADMVWLGFEEVMLDVGWWEGGRSAPEPKSDPVDWPSGMAKAADYAHQAGLRFGLYWNKGEEMEDPAGRQRRIAHIKRLFGEYNADMWRSDNTAGPVVGCTYQSVRGFYEMLDQLDRDLPNFQWENCSSGGQIKDFGAMKRAVKIFNSDAYSVLNNRKCFYGASHMYPPAQLMGHLCYYGCELEGDVLYWFRSCSMGAPEWFIDAPNGGNGGKPWTPEERAAVKQAVATYKTRIRPLVRSADLYHILPRPDGVNWDGIQYFDPMTRKGVVYLFKPSAAVADTITLKLRGLEAGKRYRVMFEDGSNPAVEKTGAELSKGLEVTLKGVPISELVWIEEINQ